jgi:hypothetical protein
MGNDLQRQKIQAQWQFQDYEPKGCYTPGDCSVSQEMRIKTDTKNVYTYTQKKKGPGCSEDELQFRVLGFQKFQNSMIYDLKNEGGLIDEDKSTYYKYADKYNPQDLTKRMLKIQVGDMGGCYSVWENTNKQLSLYND